MSDIRNLYIANGALPSVDDRRDKKITELISCAKRVPKKYDNEIMDFVLDQGQSSMCVACSLTLLRYWQEYDQSANRELFSPAYIYGNRGQNDYKGEGMQPREALRTLKNFGVPKFKDFPGFYSCDESARLYSLNKESLDLKAFSYRISKYYRVKSDNEIKNTIMILKGVSAMIPVYDCLYDVDGSGIVKYDDSDDNFNYGYHQVALKGWNEKGWIMQNSWAKSWGKDGLCILPYDYPIIEAWAVVDDIFESKLI